MKLLTFLLLAFPLAAQVTAVKTTSTTVTAVAGPVTCTFFSASPVPATGIAVKCADSVTSVTSSGLPPAGSTSGIVGQLTSAGNSITWAFTLPTAGGPISYSIVATPSGGTGSTGAGTF